MSYRRVGYAEQVGYIIKFKLRQIGKRFKLLFTRNKKCRSCCLFCKYANTCMEELL